MRTPIQLIVLVALVVLVGALATDWFDRGASEALAPEQGEPAPLPQQGDPDEATSGPEAVRTLPDIPQVPQEDELVEAPELSGVVLLPDGGPAAGAYLVLDREGGLAFLEQEDGEPGENLVHARTGEEGRFAFPTAPAGPVRITAGARGFAPSETQLVARPGGEPVEDLLLSLRRGGVLVGEVLRRDGTLAAQRSVRMMQAAEDDNQLRRRLTRWVTSDDQGRFRFEHLYPGEWQAVSLPDEEEEQALGIRAVEHLVQANVTIVDEQETFLVLGAPGEDAVRVSGTIRLAGEPAKALSQWIGEFPDPMGTQQIAQGSDDGAYEVVLPRPGAWWIKLMGPAGSEEYRVDIPAAPEHQLDFDLPTGVLAGRVVDRDGAPVEGARLSQVRIAGGDHRIGFLVADDAATSAEDGAFEMKSQGPGTYAIGVLHKTAGAGTLEVTLAAGERLDDLEIALAPGATLSGRVLDAEGLAVSRAPIWIQDAEGRVLNPVSSLTSDKEGRFTTPPLPLGEYALLAHRGTEVAHVVGLRNDAEDGEAVELRLVPGATLVVETTRADERLRASVSVRDGAGRQHSGLRNRMDPWAWQRYPFDSYERHLGPLPPGTYRVRAEVPGVGVVEETVAVTPGETRSIRLGL